MMNAVNRRQFLARSVAALMGVAALPGAVAETAAPPRRFFRKAYMLGTFPGPDISLMEKFIILRQAGFQGVEPPSHLDQDEVIRARDESGLAVCSVSCGGQSRLLANPSPSVRQRGVEGIQQALRDARRYGAASILVVPGGVNRETSYDDNYRWTQEGIRQCLPLAGELGVKLAVENVWNNFLLSPLEAARYVDEFDSPWVGFHFDIGNVAHIGWPEQWIRILGKRIVQVHVKEFSRKKMNDEGLRKGFAAEFLEGDIDWPSVMRSLDEIGYRGWAIAEPAWRPQGVEPAERLRQVAEKMDAIFAS